MKRRIIVLFVLMTTLCISLWAQTEANFDIDLNQTGDGVIIKKYNGSVVAVVIPQMIYGFPVREIGQGAFRDSRITSVVIPNLVTHIRESAFNSCKSLTAVTIGESVTIIEDYAFYSCENLTTVSIPATVVSIGGFAFSHCRRLTTFNIPQSVRSIRFPIYSSWRISGAFNSTNLNFASQAALRRVGYTEDL